MGLEVGTYISDLIPSNPTGLDDRSTADDHIRLIKAVLKATFPFVNGAVRVTQDQLNALTSIVGDLQGNIDDAAQDLVTLNSRVTEIEVSIGVLNAAVASIGSLQTNHYDRLLNMSVSVAALESQFDILDAKADQLESDFNSKLPQGQLRGGRISQSATATTLPAGWTSQRTSSGVYQVNHFLGTQTANHVCVATPYYSFHIISEIIHFDTDYFIARFADSNNAPIDTKFSFMFIDTT